MPKPHDVFRGIIACRVEIEGAEPSEGTVEARSSAHWGHWVADAGRGAGFTVTSFGALSRVGETSPQMALSASIDLGSTGARCSEPVLLDENNGWFDIIHAK